MGVRSMCQKRGQQANNNKRGREVGRSKGVRTGLLRDKYYYSNCAPRYPSVS